jgi:hypothetical protein
MIDKGVTLAATAGLLLARRLAKPRRAYADYK